MFLSSHLPTTKDPFGGKAIYPNRTPAKLINNSGSSLKHDQRAITPLLSKMHDLARTAISEDIGAKIIDYSPVIILESSIDYRARIKKLSRLNG